MVTLHPIDYYSQLHLSSCKTARLSWRKSGAIPSALPSAPLIRPHPPHPLFVSQQIAVKIDRDLEDTNCKYVTFSCKPIPFQIALAPPFWMVGSLGQRVAVRAVERALGCMGWETNMSSHPVVYSAPLKLICRKKENPQSHLPKRQ